MGQQNFSMCGITSGKKVPSKECCLNRTAIKATGHGSQVERKRRRLSEEEVEIRKVENEA